jgi:hypothetical protein
VTTRVLNVVGALFCLCLIALPDAGRAAPGAFANWAAVVVAGDFHAHDGGPTEAFDNARRDVTTALIGAGFSADHIQQFSVRPERYPKEKVLPAQPSIIAGSLEYLSRQAREGCLIYFSSHGAPEGIVLNDGLFRPAAMAAMVDNICGQRPTVVILSACFSGVFIPTLKDANRVILTAARPDRTSFGCTQNDRYPYYDDCIISSFPKASNFSGLASAARACVAAREIKEGASPPSEPQLSVGGAIGPDLPFYTFATQ